MRTNNKFLRILMLAVILVAGTNLKAQPGFEDDINDAPVDGGVSLLVIAGTAYGISRLKRKNSDMQNAEQN